MNISKIDAKHWENKVKNFRYVFARYFTMDDTVAEKVLHTHEFGIVTCLKAGVINFRTENDSWVLSPGTIVYIPAHYPHVTEVLGQCSITAAYIPKQACKVLKKNISIIELTPLLEAILNRMCNWELDFNYSPEQKRLSGVAIDELKKAQRAQFFHIPLPKSPQLSKVSQEILISPADMSVTSFWAKSCGMSLRSFTRHFHHETGQTFTIWRQKVKIYWAIKWLLNGKSVSDISFELGYQSVSAFIAMFKSHTGFSPREYLKSSSHSVNVSLDKDSFDSF